MESPDGWVYVVALHELRRRRVRRRKERELLLRSAREDEVQSSFSTDFHALIGDLSDRQRTAVVLRHVGDLPEKEIAAAMGVSRSTVSSTLRDAYSTLRRVLEQMNNEVFP